jgi:L-arabinose isomerase
MKEVASPRIAIIGLSLEFYYEQIPGFCEMVSGQFDKYCGEITSFADVLHNEICFKESQVESGIKKAKKMEVDCILIAPMCYATSLTSLQPLMNTDIPVVIWNTQEAETIDESYDFDALVRNHVTQGTQDLSNVLLRNEKIFGMESGHYKDKAALTKLEAWLCAARALRFSSKCRVGRLGQPFQGMGDFEVDENEMEQQWGPKTIQLSTDRFAKLFEKVNDTELDGLLKSDRERFAISPELTEEVHRLSLRLEIALRHLVKENSLDAFTMNFMELIDAPKIPTLPFLGINKLIEEGMGYAGEGDVMTAALLAEMRQLVGSANFTEIYTVDYQSNLMVMTHMQECNPAMARNDSKIKLIKKDFWAEGCEPYAGMHFTLEPGPVTLICITPNINSHFRYIVYEAEIQNRQPFEKFDIPHWVIKLDESVSDFLTRYSMAGGSHHLAAVSGKQAEVIKKLAKLHNVYMTALNE